MDPPLRRRAAAVDTARPGVTAAAAAAAAGPQEQRSGNLARAAAGPDKVLTAQALQEFARQKKLERERRREEEAARLRAAKLAAAHRSADSGPVWNPASSAATAAARSARPGHGLASHAASRAGSCNSCPTSSSSSSGSSEAADPLAISSIRSMGGCHEERQSISSGAEGGARVPLLDLQAAPPVAAPAAPTSRSVAAGATLPPAIADADPASNRGPTAGGSLKSSSSTTRWSPRKLPRPQQARGSSSGHASAPAVGGTAAHGPSKGVRALQAQPPQPRQSSRPASLPARVPSAGAAPAALLPPQPLQPTDQRAAAVAERQQLCAPPPAAAAAAVPDAELDSAELEARRIQQLIDWSALLVQATATVAAERVLLGPAALLDSQAPSAEELPLSYGRKPPTRPEARSAVAQQQVAAAVAALEQQRQLKLAMLAAAGQQQGPCALSPADRQLLQAEAAADLQAQSLLAHWAVQAACEGRQHMGTAEQ